jgi:hypothetical protein
MSDQPPCPQREIFAHEVVIAVQAVYKAKADFDAAAKSKTDTAPFSLPLAEARAAERKSVAALNAHRKVHGC